MDYKVNCEALTSVGFSAEERTTIWKIVSAILHLVRAFIRYYVREGKINQSILLRGLPKVTACVQSFL